MARVFCLLLIGAVLSISMAGATASASPASLVVDDDGVQCSAADYTSIQAAVTAAPAGATISVCPGLYNETVIVDKTLTLRGAGGAPQSRSGDPAREAVVTGTGLWTFELQADSVVLSGFTVRGLANGPGIYTSPAFSGYLISGNLIEDNVFGLYLNSSGTKESVVRDNVFRANNRSGSASGDGIYSDQGLHNVTIERNVFTGHESAAMVFAGTGQSDLRIRHNRLVDDNSIVVFNASDVEISDNASLRPEGTGILIGGGVNGATVAHNRIDEGDFRGIRVADFLGTGPNTAVVIAHNVVRGNGTQGIELSDVTGSRVERNQVLANGGDGIRLTETATGNVVEGNHMRSNGGFDAHDLSSGADTAGTANTWTRNHCNTDSPDGLCD